MAVNWLITGGCGFIGLNLIRTLLADGEATIRVVDNLSVGNRKDLASLGPVVDGNAESASDKGWPWPMPGIVELVEGDVLDAALAQQAVVGAEVVVHLAANTGVAASVRQPLHDCRVNVIGTLNYLEAARRADLSRFIMASSGAPIGECEPPIHEKLPCRPVSPYGASKLAGEGYCSAYHKTFGVPTVALRFGNVYGPMSAAKSSVVAKFIRQALSGRDIEIYGDGNQTRDFIHVSDLVAAILAAAARPEACGEVFQIATHRETSVNELVATLHRILPDLGCEDFKVIHTKQRRGDVLRNYSDTSKARDRLGWQAIVGLESGLRETAAWFAGLRTTPVERI